LGQKSEGKGMTQHTSRAPLKSDRPAELRWIPILAGAFAVLVAVAATLALTAERDAGLADRAEQFASIGGDFTLTGPGEEPVSLTDFRGKVVVVYFGFTYCPDVCPIHLALISAALEEVGADAEAIQPLFISLDPARDTPDIMAQYVAYFDERMLGLTGSAGDINTVASQYAVAHSIEGDPASETYTINHSSAIYVIGRGGRIADLLSPELTPTQLAAQLRRHL
jgi:protein SCO1/2